MCTNFRILNKNSEEIVIGRSMEFAFFLDAKIFYSPHIRGINKQCFYNPFTQKYCSPEEVNNYKFEWKSKYAFISTSSFNQELATDGFNTEGLYVGALLLNCTEYQKITTPSKGLYFLNFCNWVLSSFKSCKEVHNALSNGEVQIGNPLKENFGLHFAIHDASGESMVVEIVNEKINLYCNTKIGVMTNDPELPWHMQNLQNYTCVTPHIVKNMPKGNFKIPENRSLGSGFELLPGGQLPSARYIRTAMMVNYSILEHNSQEGLMNSKNLAFHILNTVDIPYGIARESFDTKNDPLIKNDYTMYSTVSDLTNKIYYIRLYNSPIVYSYNLDKISNEVFEKRQIDIPTEEFAIDKTYTVTESIVQPDMVKETTLN